jgi:hypothetical protein
MIGLVRRGTVTVRRSSAPQSCGRTGSQLRMRADADGLDRIGTTSWSWQADRRCGWSAAESDEVAGESVYDAGELRRRAWSVLAFRTALALPSLLK